MARGVKRIKFPAATRRKIWAKCGGRCAYCGEDLHGKQWTIDHIRPLIKGGNNKTPNLLLSCERCNKAKGSMTLAKFRKWVQQEKPEWFPRHDGIFWKDKLIPATTPEKAPWWRRIYSKIKRWWKNWRRK